MRNLATLFGDKPRVRVLEAVLNFGPHPFTRGELARDAGITRRSAHRAFQEVQELGLVKQVRGGAVPVFEADRASVTLQLLRILDQALELAWDGDDVAPQFTARVAEVLHVPRAPA